MQSPTWGMIFISRFTKNFHATYAPAAQSDTYIHIHTHITTHISLRRCGASKTRVKRDSIFQKTDLEKNRCVFEKQSHKSEQISGGFATSANPGKSVPEAPGRTLEKRGLRDLPETPRRAPGDSRESLPEVRRRPRRSWPGGGQGGFQGGQGGCATVVAGFITDPRCPPPVPIL